MDENLQIGPRDYSRVLSDLMKRINRIKVMLWAGDAASARTEMQEIRKLYEIPILHSLSVKSGMLSRNRVKEIREEVEPRYLGERRKKWELEYLVRAQIAKQMSAKDRTEAALFSIAPIASLVTKLDRRISRETDQPQIFDNLDEKSLKALPESSEDDVAALDVIQPSESGFDSATGFRLLVFSRGDQTWEMRGYQVNPPELDPQQLFRRLSQQPDFLTEELEEDVTVKSWPLRINGFSRSGHFKFTVFDPGRFSLLLILSHAEDPAHWLKMILEAIGSSQGQASSKNSDEE
jgi:hypothetical protein